ncbi:MAG TPA: hypothetical protein VN442_01205 [Bryobacteraceae bacterium]|nr:hypothetical protein [Bryobacteraceae bacterium]
MEATPSYGYYEAQPPFRLTKEQHRFWTCLRDVCQRYWQKPNGPPRNPIGDLLFNVSPEWRRAIIELPDAYGLRRGGRQSAGDSHRAMLERWAEEHGLTCDGNAAAWVVQHVDDRLRAMRAEISADAGPGTGPSTEVEATSPAPRNLPAPFVIYLDSPDRLFGENWKQYRSRILKAAKARADELRATSKRKPTKAPGGRKCGNYEHIHYEFLILAICGVPWTEIWRKYEKGCRYRTASTIREGALSVASLIGLDAPRFRRGRALIQK